MSHVNTSECYLELAEFVTDILDPTCLVESEILSSDNSRSWGLLLLQIMNELTSSQDMPTCRWSAELVHFFKATFSATLGRLCTVSEYAAYVFIY